MTARQPVKVSTLLGDRLIVRRTVMNFNANNITVIMLPIFLPLKAALSGPKCLVLSKRDQPETGPWARNRCLDRPPAKFQEAWDDCPLKTAKVQRLGRPATATDKRGRQTMASMDSAHSASTNSCASASLSKAFTKDPGFTPSCRPIQKRRTNRFSRSVLSITRESSSGRSGCFAPM